MILSGCYYKSSKSLEISEEPQKYFLFRGTYSISKSYFINFKKRQLLSCLLYILTTRGAYSIGIAFEWVGSWT